MSLDIQTNIASLIAQNNLNVNSNFMTQTITRLTSGYRINSSADDAAGLVIANEYRSSVTELTQGVRNANDGISTLQIVDGGLNNISTMMDRMMTLATQSASGTFTGNRATLDQEYQQLISEINRQATNIGLNNGGSNNTTVNVFIGGGTQTNSQISVNLSGTGNTVDAAGLGLTGTSLLGAGSTFAANSVNLNTTPLLLAGAANASQVFTFNLAGGTTVTATVTSPTSSGITVQNAVQQLNSVLNSYGLGASVNSAGALTISGNAAFTGSAAAASNGTGLVTGGATALITNGTNYDLAGQTTFTALTATTSETLTYTVGGNSASVTLNGTNAASTGAAVQTLNSALSGLGLSAVENSAGTGIDVQGPSAFSVTISGPNAGVYSATSGTQNAATPTVTTSSTSNALSAITALNNAINSLGNVQGTVGAGENKLNYAIGLANSQITSFSAAESRIRDADMAAEAANLTKAQILEQSSIAAMAQANAAPQAVLALLK